jgi:type IV pilus assembly protein PilO
MLKTKMARWSSLTALLCVALLGIAWVLLISPRRAEAADIRSQAESTRAQNETLQLKVAQLKAQFAELPKSRAELNQIYRQMPFDAAMPELVRSIDAAASSSGVSLQSLTPSVAAEVGAPAQPTVPNPTAGADSGAGAQAAAQPAAAGAEAGKAASGGPRVVAIPVSIVTRGDYFQSVLFLKKLQTEMQRAFAVTNLQMAVSAASSSSQSGVTMTVTGKVFALPDAAAEAAAGSTATRKSATGSTGATAGEPAALGGASRVGATASRVTEDS